MKVLLINPRYDEKQYRYKANKLCPPLGMAYIASVLLQAGHQVRILDMEALSMEYAELPEYLMRDPPKVVGIHCTTPVFHLVQRLGAIVKECCPGSTLILGGPHASLMPHEALTALPEADYLLRGEAEYTFRDLLAALSQDSCEWQPESIPGLSYRRRNGSLHVSSQIVRIDDLDGLPLPAYDLLPLDRYHEGSRLVETGSEGRTFTMMTSRGCPTGCIFCSESLLAGRRFRGRSPGNVVDEMEVLVSRYGINDIVFFDASFIDTAERVEGICAEILRRGLQVTWRARCRADKLTDGLASLMKKAGCLTLAIGVEAGSQRLLDIMHKQSTLEDIERAFEIAHRHGLWTVGYFMFGTPGETRAESEQTIEFAKRLDPDWALFTHATPLPGTDLFKLNSERLAAPDWSQFRFSANYPVLGYDGMDQNDLRQFMDHAFQEFYVRKEWLLGRLRKATKPGQMELIVDSFFHYLGQAKKA